MQPQFGITTGTAIRTATAENYFYFYFNFNDNCDCHTPFATTAIATAAIFTTNYNNQ
jgi:hypothetical protein